MCSRVLVLLLVTAGGVIVSPLSGADRPTSQDLADLSAHLQEVPPESFDVDVVAEYMLKKASEESLRGSVERLFAHTDDAVLDETPEQRQANLENEVQRLLAEQERPRRMRERIRYSREMGYRWDYVIERIDVVESLYTGPAETAEFTDAKVFPSNHPDDTRHLYLRFKAGVAPIASLYEQPGARLQVRQIWSGGTLDWFVAMALRSLLRVGTPEHDSQLDAVRSGTHPYVGMRVTRGIPLPDGTPGRLFEVQIRGGAKRGTATFEVPENGFDPVWKVRWGGQTVMEVLEARDGVATVWKESGPDAPAGGRVYTLLSRQLNVPLDPEVFAFKAPPGYTSVDHTVTPVKIVYFDGRVEYKEPREPLQKAKQPSWFGGLHPYLHLLLLNLFLLGVFVLRLRRLWRLKSSRTTAEKTAQ